MLSAGSVAGRPARSNRCSRTPAPLISTSRRISGNLDTVSGENRSCDQLGSKPRNAQYQRTALLRSSVWIPTWSIRLGVTHSPSALRKEASSAGPAGVAFK